MAPKSIKTPETPKNRPSRKGGSKKSVFWVGKLPRIQSEKGAFSILTYYSTLKPKNMPVFMGLFGLYKYVWTGFRGIEVA